MDDDAIQRVANLCASKAADDHVIREYFTLGELRRIAARLRSTGELREAQESVISAARLFLKEGTRVTQRGDGYFFQQVIEKKDKSDPHYKLCVAVEALDAAIASTPAVPEQGDAMGLRK